MSLVYKLFAWSGNMADWDFLYKHEWNTKSAFARNTISSHVKFHTRKITVAMVTYENRAFRCLAWKDLVFHWCLYNKKNITRPLGDTKFLFLCWTLEDKFRISARPCNILFTEPIVLSSLEAKIFVGLISDGLKTSKWNRPFAKMAPKFE